MTSQLRVLYIGHVSCDRNVIEEEVEYLPGGGVWFAGVAAARLGAKTHVATKCADKDVAMFKDPFTEVGVTTTFLPSAESTSCENAYPDRKNPEDRRQRMISLASPFTEAEVTSILAEVGEVDAVVVNPLWYGEFPESLLHLVKREGITLAADSQGFIRHVLDQGKMEKRVWEAQREFLPLLDILKVDESEARVLASLDPTSGDWRRGVEMIHGMGAKLILATHTQGVATYDGQQWLDAKFGEYSMEGRTGRGDTATAAYLSAIKEGKTPQVGPFLSLSLVGRCCDWFSGGAGLCGRDHHDQDAVPWAVQRLKV